MAYHDDRLVVEPRQTTHNGVIVGKAPVASKRSEFGEQGLDIVFAVWAVRVSRHLTFLPRC